MNECCHILIGSGLIGSGSWLAVTGWYIYTYTYTYLLVQCIWKLVSCNWSTIHYYYHCIRLQMKIMKGILQYSILLLVYLL